MADNTTIDAGSGGDKIATDELATLNGAAQVDPKPKAQRVKVVHGADGVGTDVSSASPLPVDDDGTQAALATVSSTLTQILGTTDGLEGFVDGLEAALATLNGKDFSTAAKQDAAKTVLDSILLAVDGLESNTTGLATQTTAAAILAKLSADPATQTTLAAVLAAVDGLEGSTDGIEAALALLATSAQVGEVQASPTANTLLDRLKTLATKLDTLHTDVDGLEANTTGLATSAKQDTLIAKDFATETTQAASATKLGIVTETAPATDTASSGLNGRLQRIAQRLSSLIALLPASLGQKTKVNSLAVAIASDQDALAVTDNGGTLSVDDGAGSLTVDGSVSLTGAVPAGTNNIGDVDVLTVPADPFGANADAIIAAGAAGSQSAKLRRVTQGLEDLKTAIVLAAGNNNIGDVDVATVPADPFGANADAIVAAGAAGSLSAKLRRVTQGLEDLKTLVVLGAGTNNIGQVDPRGNIAHDGVDSGNPVKTGARARTAFPTAVAQDDRVDNIADKYGRQLATAAPLDQRTTGTANYTNTTAADVIAAPGAGVQLVVTAIIVTNAHATVGTKVSVRDGTTVKFTGYAAAVGGGFILQDPNGLFIATANTAVTAICGTTGADVDVSVSAYKVG